VVLCTVKDLLSNHDMIMLVRFVSKIKVEVVELVLSLIHI
jgi:hypothetical protein